MGHGAIAAVNDAVISASKTLRVAVNVQYKTDTMGEYLSACTKF